MLTCCHCNIFGTSSRSFNFLPIRLLYVLLLGSPPVHLFVFHYVWGHFFVVVHGVTISGVMSCILYISCDLVWGEFLSVDLPIEVKRRASLFSFAFEWLKYYFYIMFASLKVVISNILLREQWRRHLLAIMVTTLPLLFLNMFNLILRKEIYSHVICVISAWSSGCMSLAEQYFKIVLAQ